MSFSRLVKCSRRNTSGFVGIPAFWNASSQFVLLGPAAAFSTHVEPGSSLRKRLEAQNHAWDHAPARLLGFRCIWTPECRAEVHWC